MTTNAVWRGAALAAAFAIAATAASAQTAPGPKETKAIAEEAFLYGLPLSMYYKIMNAYAIDKNSGQFKALFNHIKNEPRVYTYKDTAVVTTNSDTLSAFLGKPAPAAAPAIDWPKIDAATEKKDVLSYLPFLLQFAPPIGPAAVEVPLREKFARIGIETGKPFPTVKLTDVDKAAMAEAAKATEGAIKAKLEKIGKVVNGWNVLTSGIGDRAVYNGDWTQRAAVAVAGILANDPAEATYPITRKDGNGQPLDGSKHTTR